MFDFLRREKEEELEPIPTNATVQAALPAPAAPVAAQPALPARTPAPNILGPGTRIDGPLSAQGDLIVRGQVHGPVTVEGRLVVELQGVVRGEISASSVVIRGTVEGDVLAEGKLEIACSGRVDGNVNARVVAVDEGGVLCGQCRMGVGSSVKASATATAERGDESFLTRMFSDDDDDSIPTLVASPA